jgi:hypothetical protein
MVPAKNPQPRAILHRQARGLLPRNPQYLPLRARQANPPSPRAEFHNPERNLQSARLRPKGALRRHGGGAQPRDAL